MNKEKLNKALAYLRKHVDWLENNDFDELYQNYNSDSVQELTEIFLKSNIKIEPISKIYDWMFWNLPIKSYTIPNSVKSIGNDAFYRCTNLTSITIPDSVTSIDYDAFWHCRNLTSITLPNSVKSIGGGAFRSCSRLTSITIPNSVTSIGEYTFSFCYSLTSINYLGTKEEWEEIKKGGLWSQNSSIEKIECKDSIINLN